MHNIYSFSTVRIGYVQTSFSVSESESDILLEIQLLEGFITPELGDVVVTVTTSDLTATGKPIGLRTHCKYE